MKATKAILHKHYKKLQEVPAGFDLFVSIHNFVACIESDEALTKMLSRHVAKKGEANLAAKYHHLRRIYQGIEDVKKKSSADIGHDRYFAIQELDKIRAKEVSESNTLWRKRDLYRRMSKEIYGHLEANFFAHAGK